MKIVTFLLALLILTGCARNVDVPEGKYGLKFELGKIEQIVSGPSKLQKKPFLESVLLINKRDSIILGDGKFTIHYRVDDPKKYYISVHGNMNLVAIIEKEIATRSLKGELVNSEDLLYKMIENMGLPITLEKAPNTVLKSGTPQSGAP